MLKHKKTLSLSCYFARYRLYRNFAPITETRQKVLLLQFCLQTGFLSEITQQIIVFYILFYIMILIFVILYFTLESM